MNAAHKIMNHISEHHRSGGDSLIERVSGARNFCHDAHVSESLLCLGYMMVCFVIKVLG